MRRLYLVAAGAALVGYSAVVVAAEEPAARPGGPGAGQQTSPAVPPASGSLSSDLNRSGGVIAPPSGIDPEIKQTPPPTGAKMPVIPPPGTPGGNAAVKPK
jgi:hypothetical protein